MTHFMHQSGKLYYGLSPNPGTNDAAAQVTSFTENTTPETVRVPATLTAPGFDRIVQTVTSLDIEFLDDSDAAGDGGFFEFLATNNGGTIWVVWQPTSATTPKAEYKCTAVRASRGGAARNPSLCRVSLPVETLTDTFPT